MGAPKVKRVLIFVSILTLMYIYMVHIEYKLVPAWVQILADFSSSPTSVFGTAFLGDLLAVAYLQPSLNISLLALYQLPDSEDETREIIQCNDYTEECARVHHLTMTQQSLQLSQCLLKHFDRVCEDMFALVFHNASSGNDRFAVYSKEFQLRFFWDFPSPSPGSNFSRFTVISDQECIFLGYYHVAETTSSHDMVAFLRDGRVKWNSSVSDSSLKEPPVKDQDRYEHQPESEWPAENHWKIYHAQRHVNYTLQAARPSVSWKLYQKSLSHAFPLRFTSPESQAFSRLMHLTGQQDHDHRQLLPPNTVLLMDSARLAVFDINSGRLITQLALQAHRGQTLTYLASLRRATISLGAATSPFMLKTWSYLLDRPASLHLLYLQSSIQPKSGLPEESDNPSRDRSFSHTISCESVSQLHRDELAWERSQFDQLDQADQQSGAENSQQVVEDEFVHVLTPGLCRPVHFFDHPRLGTDEWLEDPTKNVAPLVIDQPNQASVSFNESKHIYYVTSDGIVSCTDQFGVEQWRVVAQVSWLQIAKSAKAEQDDSDFLRVYRDQFEPSLSRVFVRAVNADPDWLTLLLSMRSYLLGAANSLLDCLVVVGWDSASILNRQDDGQFLASHLLPDTPVAPPLVVSVDQRNGSTAFVLICQGMLIGFMITRTTTLSTIACTVFVVFATIMLLNWGFQVLDRQLMDQAAQQTKQPRKRHHRHRR